MTHVADSALLVALEGDPLSDALLRRALEGEPLTAPAASALRDRLRHLTVLDPAAGSGAFLLGALDELVALRRSAGQGPVQAIKRDVLSRSLFGVDLTPTAVRLTELRLWLALVAEEDHFDLTSIAPLPNLDGHVLQGDALLDPLMLAASLGGRAFRGGAAEVRRLATARERHFTLAGPDKRKAQAELDHAETALARKLLDEGCAALESTIRELLEAARNRDLFGRRGRLNVEQRRRLGRLRAGLRELRAARRKLRQEGAAPFFSFESHFADVMHRGGFDVVIGNPPWVRAERLPARVRETLAGRYSCWQASATRGFAHQPDLAVAFTERALELARPAGVVTLLLPAKLATSGYAEPLRRRLAQTTRLERAAPLSDQIAHAFGAAVYPMALVASRADPTGTESTGTTLGPKDAGSAVPQRQLESHGPWILAPAMERISRRLRAEFPTVGDRWTPQLGVKTGADDLFLLDHQCAGSRPALRGRDVAAWECLPRRFVLWTHGVDGLPLARLPTEVWKRFEHHEERLRRRADYRAGPPWQLFRTALGLAAHRVVWADLSRRLEAALPTQVLVPLNTVYGIATRDAAEAAALCALFNSRWHTALARIVADPARGGFRRFNARVVRGLPVPPRESPAWGELARRGNAREPADDLVAELFCLDAADCRALAAHSL